MKGGELLQELLTFEFQIGIIWRGFHIVVILLQYTAKNQRKCPKPTFISSTRCRVAFDFPICKLLDLLERKDELEKSQNPAAVLVLANWAAQQTGEDARERYRWKLRLMRSAYEKGFRREDILELYRLIDWLLQLPEGME